RVGGSEQLRIAGYVAVVVGLLLVSEPVVEDCIWVVTETVTDSSTRVPPRVSNLGRVRVWVKSVGVAGNDAEKVCVPLSKARPSRDSTSGRRRRSAGRPWRPRREERRGPERDDGESPRPIAAHEQ